MLRSDTNLQLFDDLTAQLVVRNHSPYRALKEQLGTTLTHFARSLYLLITDETGVASVNLLPLFVSSETGFLSIDDDNVVAAINVRCKNCLMLTAQKSGGFDSDIAENFVGCINEMPRALDLVSLGCECLW